MARADAYIPMRGKALQRSLLETGMRILAFIGAIAVLVAIAAAGFFFGGFYSVSARYEDPKPVAWMLEKVREASIRHFASDRPPGSLDDPTAIQAGAPALRAG